MRSLFFLFALLMAFSGLAVPEAVIARRAVREPVIDGRLTEPDWKNARWVTLDRSRPARPRTDGEWNELSRMVGEYVKQQFAQNVQAAALWSERGLYFAFIVEDTDIIGRMKEGELLWLEDVVELFLARNARSGEKHPVAPLDVRAHERFDLLPPRRDPVVLLFPDTGLLHDLGIGILAFTLHNQDF